MPINWPPATAPTWPPPEISPIWFSTSDLKELVEILREIGFTHAAPTTAERSLYFPTTVRCDHNHQVTGRMLISPGGTRYPVAVCKDAIHRDVLVLWVPYYCGPESANYTF